MSRQSTMPSKKRKFDDGAKFKKAHPKKKYKKQQQYHSSSEDEESGSDAGFAPVNLNDSEDESVPVKVQTKTTKIAKILEPPAESDGSDDESEGTGVEDGSDDDEDSDTAPSQSKRKVSKRNDSEAFSTSISKILSTKLSSSARKDPVLSRSREATDNSANIANERLENRAKAKLRAEKKEELEKGRVKDVVGLSTGTTGEVAEEEKRLRKIAQRGVVKLFNAVRAAQVKGEQALREERKKGTIGMANREEKVNEMSKQSFLDIITGKKTAAVESS